MVPLAPPTFSITTGCPSEGRIASAMIRAVVSVEPPGGNGEIRVIGRDGNDWAPAKPAAMDSAIAAKSLMLPPLALMVHNAPLMKHDQGTAYGRKRGVTNTALTETGPGTRMGELLRRY